MKGKNSGSDEEKGVQTEANTVYKQIQATLKVRVVGINLQCTCTVCICACIKKNTAHYINQLLDIGQEIFAVEKFSYIFNSMRGINIS